MGVVDGFTGHAIIQSYVTFTGSDGRLITMTVESIGTQPEALDEYFDEFNYGSGAFGFVGETGLTGVTIPETVTTITGFFDCPGLTSIHIPKSVMSLGSTYVDGIGIFEYSRPFQGCSNLERITVDEENPNYDSRGDCNAIIQTWSNELLVGCKNTVIPDGVESISIDAFASASLAQTGCGEFESLCRIKEIHIPSSMTYIEESTSIYDSRMFTGLNPFRFCNSLSVITVDNGNPVYDSRDNCNALIETETNTLLAGCNNTSIPKTISKINNAAFEGSGITSIVIPSSVTEIGARAFYYCNSLKSITCERMTPPEAELLFGHYENLMEYHDEIPDYYDCVTLYVPQSAIAAYRNHEEWGKFHHIKSINNGSVCDVNGDGEVNIADLNNVIHIICTGYAYLINYDVNGDGEVNIGDANTIIDIILHY